MNRMVIGLDIDGVIVDYVHHVLPLLSEICNRTVNYEDITHRDITKCLDIDDKKAAYFWEQIFNTDLLLYSNPIKGAIEGLSALGRHEIWLITGRPESMRNLTLSWLDKNSVKYDRIVFESNKTVGNLSHERNCAVFVEDQLEVGVSLAAAGIFTLLLDQPWNQAKSLPEKCRRVYHWDEVVDEVKKLENERVR
jgi:uncharacterized HAD superfamily protein